MSFQSQLNYLQGFPSGGREIFHDDRLSSDKKIVNLHWICGSDNFPIFVDRMYPSLVISPRPSSLLNSAIRDFSHLISPTDIGL
jgi:hypothetical protein